MPQTTTTTGTWTEKEIRQQPASWLRSLNNIDNLRASIDSFLTPLLRKPDLRIVLTGAGTSAFIGDIIAPWLASHTRKNITAIPTTDLVTNP
ncbi:aldose isomerase, partial [Enterobacter cloacae subsp. cloacae]